MYLTVSSLWYFGNNASEICENLNHKVNIENFNIPTNSNFNYLLFYPVWDLVIYNTHKILYFSLLFSVLCSLRCGMESKNQNTKFLKGEKIMLSTRTPWNCSFEILLYCLLVYLALLTIFCNSCSLKALGERNKCEIIFI